MCVCSYVRTAVGSHSIRWYAHFNLTSVIRQKYAAPFFIHKGSNAPASGQDMSIHQQQTAMCGVFLHSNLWSVALPCLFAAGHIPTLSYSIGIYVHSLIYTTGLMRKYVNSSLMLVD